MYKSTLCMTPPVLKIWGVWSIPSLLLLSDPLYLGVVASVRVSKYGSNRFVQKVFVFDMTMRKKTKQKTTL